jgi:hypothetical protein
MKGLGSKTFLMALGIAILVGPAAQADAPSAVLDAGTTVAAAGVQAQLRTLDGLTKDSLRCSCQDAFGVCLIGQSLSKVVSFVLPEGYKRLSFAEQVVPQGLRASGKVYWETDDPYDARIHIECHADMLSNAEVTVSSVLGVKE